MDRQQKTNSNSRSKLPLILIIGAVLLVLIAVLLAVLLGKCGGPDQPADTASSGLPVSGQETSEPSASGQDSSADPGSGEQNSLPGTESGPGIHLHAFGEWKTLAEPDCTHPGSRERVCAECGFRQTQETSPLGHDGRNNECVRCGKKAETERMGISAYPYGDGLWITKSTGTVDGDLLLPDVIDGVPVVCVAASAFEYNEDIVSVSLPDSVVQLGNFCFANCPNLRSLRLGRNIGPQSAGLINYSPNVDFLAVDPENPVLHSDGNCVIETASKTMILGCRNSVIPDDGSVRILNCYSFQNCSGLKAITVPSPVETIQENAFCNSKDLESVLIADSVTTVGENAFSGCSALKEVRLPALLKELPDELFYNCASLEEITLPGAVSVIGSSCFEACPNLKTVRIPASAVEIRNYAFKECASLEQIDLPAGLQRLGSAFNGCKALKKIVIPEGVESLSGATFRDCSSLTEIVFPEKMTAIPRTLFAGCTGLTEIRIPEGVYQIDDYAFSGCDHLKTVYLPATLKYVYEDLFEGCTALETVHFAGTKAEWDAIRWSESDDCLQNAEVVFGS